MRRKPRASSWHVRPARLPMWKSHCDVVGRSQGGGFEEIGEFRSNLVYFTGKVIKGHSARLCCRLSGRGREGAPVVGRHRRDERGIHGAFRETAGLEADGIEFLIRVTVEVFEIGVGVSVAVEAAVVVMGDPLVLDDAEQLQAELDGAGE